MPADSLEFSTPWLLIAVLIAGLGLCVVSLLRHPGAIRPMMGTLCIGGALVYSLSCHLRLDESGMTESSLFGDKALAWRDVADARFETRHGKGGDSRSLWLVGRAGPAIAITAVSRLGHEDAETLARFLRRKLPPGLAHVAEDLKAMQSGDGNWQYRVVVGNGV